MRKVFTMKGFRTALLLAATLVVATPRDLVAQTETLVAPGDRVRITAPTISADRVVGTLYKLDGDVCVLRIEGRSPMKLPLAEVATLEVSRGSKSRAGVGALVGLAVGATTGAFLGHSWGSESCDDGSTFCLEKAENAVLTGTVFGLVGAGIGALTGSFIEVERWEEIALDELRIEASALSPDGVSVSVSLRL